MTSAAVQDQTYDYIIIGSGFGGSVSALRLAQKGYRVLVLEKGKWYHHNDFPKTNWDLKRWLWLPQLKWGGIMRLTILKHIGILSGTGVGGGSLVYAATLPKPKSPFFKTGSWAQLQDWEAVLEPFYERAYRMLGANKNPHLGPGDQVLKAVATQMGRASEYEPAMVGIYFPSQSHDFKKEDDDPYFDGEGPKRMPCRHCGACMTGCPYGSKNSLDKNYLYLAQKHQAKIVAQQMVYDVIAHGAQGEEGYTVYCKDTFTWGHKKQYVYHAKGIVFSAGVLGTIKLLLQLKQKGRLPSLSARLGEDIRSNNECLIGITTPNTDVDYTEGIAIGGVYHADEHSHVETNRYGRGSGFWRLSFFPMAYGSNIFIRLARMTTTAIKDFPTYWRILTVKDWAKNSQILTFMQHLDSTLRFRLNRFGWLSSEMGHGAKPTPYIPLAKSLAMQFADLMQGKPFTFLSEQLTYTPNTAHILGGAVMAASPEHGVINDRGQVFGYHKMYVCDGSMISANPGVNPSLTITALCEYVMEQIEPNTFVDKFNQKP